MNILKVVSQKSWHLDNQTQTQIYKSLVRSLIEYSAILFDTLNAKLKNMLNSIQYNALCIIYNKDKSFGNSNLLNLAKIETIGERMNKLKNSFVNDALTSQNPLIEELVKDYKNFKCYGKNNFNLKKKTPMCSIKIENIIKKKL